MKSFSDLLDLHQQLDDLFLEHQRALMRLDLTRAASLLDQYETQLLAHIRDEEDLMIPLYQQRAAAPIGAAAEIFLGEHEKLRHFLGLFKQEIAKIKQNDDIERGVLFLIDSQHLFKRLLVHHDTRERKMLYPLLDDVTTESERRQLFQRLELQPTIKAHAATAR
ncbi:MAG TPA: hemerythrin domain-containing protein [Pyrinomonadaceae bacterium]|jgi:hemerythrin-like domain-containing protein|nr:hemerythrin domain-containing protein [Pyrinomonadaceae bacterium]